MTHYIVNGSILTNLKHYKKNPGSLPDEIHHSLQHSALFTDLPHFQDALIMREIPHDLEQ